ncbi:MAG: DnaD domain protein [Oscillospiraceae bacterium]
MYRVAAEQGDSIAVPQLVFARLLAPGNEARFKVALYCLQKKEASADDVAEALRMKLPEAEKALEYWEGAGLLEKQEDAQTVETVISPRRRLSTREVTTAASKDNRLGQMVQELQHLFGGVLSPSDICIVVTLYTADGIPAEMILLCASHIAGKGIFSARYLEKLALSWWRDGIRSAADVDDYLCQLAKQEKLEKQVAEKLNISAEGLTVAEKKHIIRWFNEYGFDMEMIQNAQAHAGQRGDDIKYISGILKKWYAKGYKAPKDVRQAGEGHNVRVQGSRAFIPPEEDILLNTVNGHTHVRNGGGK